MKRHVSIMNSGEHQLEYSIMGEGAPILLFHGGHSGCMEEFGVAPLLAAGYRIVIPSRAGYGRTSPETDLTNACRLYAELLDHLGLDKVHVIAVSAGGPTGIRFSALFPDRVTTLTLQCAVTGSWLTPADKEYRMASRLFHPNKEKRTWRMLAGMSSLMPKLTFRMMASSFSALPYREIQKRLDNGYAEAFRDMNKRQRSYAGFMIDLVHTQADYAVELAAIQAPTLIMHSRNDGSVPLRHAERARDLIRRTEWCVLDSWGHLIWIGRHAPEFDRALLAFLSRQGQPSVS